MQKELFIIRHGETDFNKEGIVQGRGVNPPLNSTGRQQAALFYRYYKNEGFEAVFTSTLLRAQESVAAFCGSGIPCEIFSELDEISWGFFEGKPANQAFKAEYRHLLSRWKNGDLSARAEGGESPVEVSIRQQKFIDHLQSRPEKKVLICMHGRAMRIFLPTLLKEDLISMEDYPHHNLTLYKVRFDGNYFRIDQFNNMDHLYYDAKV